MCFQQTFKHTPLFLADSHVRPDSVEPSPPGVVAMARCLVKVVRSVIFYMVHQLARASQKHEAPPRTSSCGPSTMLPRWTFEAFFCCQVGARKHLWR